MSRRSGKGFGGLSRVTAGIALAIGAFALSTPARAVTWQRVIGSGDEVHIGGASEPDRIERIRQMASRVSDDGWVVSAATTVTSSGSRRGETPLFYIPNVQIFSFTLPSPNFVPFDAIHQVEMNRSGEMLLRGELPPLPIPCGESAFAAQREVLAVFRFAGRIVAESFEPIADTEFSYVSSVRRCVLPSGPCFSTARASLGDDGRVAHTALVSSDVCTKPAIEALFGPGDTVPEQLISLAGDPAPGAPEGVAFGESLAFDWSDRSMNATGSLAVHASLDDGNEALYRSDPDGELTLLVRTGESAAIADGVSFERLQLAAIDAAGIPAFFATQSPDSAGSNGLWVPDAEGGVRPIARTGDPVPGAPPGAVFEDFFPAGLRPVSFGARGEPPFLNGVGEVAAVLRFSMPGLETMWGVFGPIATSEFTLRLVSGAPAPGLEGRTLHRFELLGFDDSRELLVRVEVSPTGGNEETEPALYLLSPEGDAQLLLSGDDELELTPGRRERVGDLADLRIGRSFDLQHLAVLATADDLHGTSAVFVTQVPEPDESLSLLAAGGSIVWLARRRR